MGCWQCTPPASHLSNGGMGSDPRPIVKGRILTIVSNGGKLLCWRLYHTDGRVITVRDNILEYIFTTSMQVPATLGNGIYLLHVKTDKGMEVHKVMVE